MLCFLKAKLLSLAGQPNKALAQSRTANKIGRLSLAIYMSLLGVLSPVPLVAGGSERPESPCGTVWADVVEQVRPYGPRLLPPKNGIVFVGNDGQAYDCLNMGIPNQLLEITSQQDRQFFDLIKRQENRDYFESVACVAGLQEFVGNSWVTIYLPYEVEQLSSQKCRKRLPVVFEVLKEAIGE